MRQRQGDLGAGRKHGAGAIGHTATHLDFVLAAATHAAVGALHADLRAWLGELGISVDFHGVDVKNAILIAVVTLNCRKGAGLQG